MPEANEPRTFTDTKGRLWTVRITGAELKRVREMTGVRLADLDDDGYQPLAALLKDVEKLIDVIFVLCLDEANERKVSDYEFGRSLAGDVLTEAAEAFRRAFEDFCPSQRRQVMQSLASKAKVLQEKAGGLVMEAITQIDPDQMIEKLREELFERKKHAANSPESAAPIGSDSP